MTGLLLDTELTPPSTSTSRPCAPAANRSSPIINDILDFSKIEAGQLELNESPSTCAPAWRGPRPHRAQGAREAPRPRPFRRTTTCPPASSATTSACVRSCSTLSATPSSSPSHGEISLEVTGRAVPPPAEGIRASSATSGKSPSRSRTPAWAFRTTRWSCSSRPSARSTPPPRAPTAAPASASSFASGWCISWAAPFPSAAKSARARPSCSPSARLPPPAPEGTARRNAAGQALLVVDDNETNLSILALHTQRWGMEVTAAASGDEALARLQEGTIRRRHPRLHDARHGRPRARRAHARVRERKKMPIILLSSGDPEIDPARWQVGYFSSCPSPGNRPSCSANPQRFLAPVNARRCRPSRTAAHSRAPLRRESP